ncbi:hypothetical protein HOY82DRAFT_488296 [Tuber indicum]|nr:hypothetical protein HOY82DRAFT_488296 [Tuber indicum]
MCAATKIIATLKSIGKWAQENQTLAVGLGSVGVLVANERCGRRDIKAVFARLRTHVDDELADIKSEVEFMNAMSLSSSLRRPGVNNAGTGVKNRSQDEAH